MKKSGKRQEEQGGGWTEWMRSLLKGSILALTMALVLLLACSAAVSGGWLNQGSMERAVVAVCVAGSLTGAAAAMRRHRDLALPLGIGTGAALFFLLLGLGTLLFEEAPTADRFPTILCACLCGGTMAGILGRKTKKKRRR